MQKTYKGFDYLVAFLVTLGCSIFILFPVKFWSLSTTIIAFIIFLVVVYALNTNDDSQHVFISMYMIYFSLYKSLIGGWKGLLYDIYLNL